MRRLTGALLQWYGKNKNVYPWRQTKDPYRVWLSEILLQQTRIPVVLRFYEVILSEYPTLRHLVAAEDSSFLAQWSGIGYYQRGRNMLRCAREIATRYGGRFPSDLPFLLSLPGIGPYTAGALRNLCFGKLTPAIDGNISRVLARVTNIFHLINTRSFREEAEKSFLELGAGSPPDQFFQALMELGERICLPQPDCPNCPLRSFCSGYREGIANMLPRRPGKKKTEEYHWYFLALPKGNSFYYVRNGTREFLKDSWMFPDLLTRRELSPHQIRNEFRILWKITFPRFREYLHVSHSVTFRRIKAHILLAERFQIENHYGRWLSQAQIKRHPTSSLTHKILKRLQL